MQVRTFAGTEADMVTAITMTHAEEAIHAVDAATDRTPAYFMINCARPTHFSGMLAAGEGRWRGGIRGLGANAPRGGRSHAELDKAQDLDDGNADELATQHAELRRCLPRLTVLGGCCGTDHRHVEAIGRPAGSRRASSVERFPASTTRRLFDLSISRFYDITISTNSSQSGPLPGSCQAAARSVLVKSSPLNSRGSPVSWASA